MKRLFVVLVASSLMLLAFTTARAKDISNPSEGYSFKLPDDWKEISRADIDQAVSNIAKSGTSLRYVAAYEPAAHATVFTYPYSMVQTIPHKNGKSISGVSEADLRSIVRELSGISDADIKKNLSASAADLITSTSDRSASYFTDPPGFTFSYVINTPMGRVRGQSIGIIGRDHINVVHMYALADKFSEFKPVIDGVAGSIRFDAAQQVKLQSGFMGMPIETWVGIVVGIVACALIFMFIRRRAG